MSLEKVVEQRTDRREGAVFMLCIFIVWSLPLPIVCHCNIAVILILILILILVVVDYGHSGITISTVVALLLMSVA